MRFYVGLYGPPDNYQRCGPFSGLTLMSEGRHGGHDLYADGRRLVTWDSRSGAWITGSLPNTDEPHDAWTRWQLEFDAR